MRDEVKDYYGRQLQSSADLKTSACCDTATLPGWLKPLLANVHPQVSSRYYGCGLVAPIALDGCRILDLGCGSGRDCYVLAQLAGANGSVLGVDMTEEQLAVAEAHRAWHAEKFGHDKVRFQLGYIEELDALGLEDASFDVIVSNCVVNLSPHKDRVLAHIHRLLKPGGEFYFSDIYADRRVPAALRNDPLLYGECLGGALYWNDFLTLARQAGFADPRLVESRPIELTDSTVAQKVGPLRFYSATYRLFKLDGLEPACEDYGQAVVYRGTLTLAHDAFRLDAHHLIEAGKTFAVCGNTWRMLHDSRFAAHFEFIGDFSRHYGIFPGCGGGLPFTEKRSTEAGGDDVCACC